MAQQTVSGTPPAHPEAMGSKCFGLHKELDICWIWRHLGVLLSAGWGLLKAQLPDPPTTTTCVILPQDPGPSS